MSAIVIENRNSDLLAELVTEGVLLCLLEGDQGRIGVALIAGEVVSGLIQQQTIGTVGLPKSTKRPLTQTNAAMCTPLADKLFTQVALMLEGDNDQQTIPGFQDSGMERVLPMHLRCRSHWIKMSI